MKILKPQKLKTGMTIGLLSISGAIEDKAEIETAKQRLEKSGYKVVVCRGKNYRDMAGTKEICLENLHKFFADKNIFGNTCKSVRPYLYDDCVQIIVFKHVVREHKVLGNKACAAFPWRKIAVLTYTDIV